MTDERLAQIKNENPFREKFNMNLHRRCLIAIAVLLALSSSQALAQIAFVKTIGTTPSTSNGTKLRSLFQPQVLPVETV